MELSDTPHHSEEGISLPISEFKFIVRKFGNFKQTLRIDFSSRIANFEISLGFGYFLRSDSTLFRDLHEQAKHIRISPDNGGNVVL
jgi:hypothetical protein